MDQLAVFTGKQSVVECSCSKARGMVLAGLHSWASLLTMLNIQIGPVGGLSDYMGLLTKLHCQVGPLAGHCNHFQMNKVRGDLPWQDSATS